MESATVLGVAAYPPRQTPSRAGAWHLPLRCDEVSPGVDESEEHDRRFARSETMRRPWLHVEPKARSRIELFPIRDELESAFRDLHNGRARCLMLAQPRSCVEAKDRDLNAVVAEDHARHDCAGLNIDRGRDVGTYEAWHCALLGSKNTC